LRLEVKVLENLLKTSSPYLGMIGSKTKVKTVTKKLEIKDFSRLYAPVGLNIGGDSPAEIALAIASEILKVKYKKGGKSLSES
jgi:xanthine dehydrogenase accessory factor